MGCVAAMGRLFGLGIAGVVQEKNPGGRGRGPARHGKLKRMAPQGVVARLTKRAGRYCEDCRTAEPGEGTDIRDGVRACTLERKPQRRDPKSATASLEWAPPEIPSG